MYAVRTQGLKPDYFGLDSYNGVTKAQNQGQSTHGITVRMDGGGQTKVSRLMGKGARWIDVRRTANFIV
jgi:hypothetical protein